MPPPPPYRLTVACNFGNQVIRDRGGAISVLYETH